MKLDRNINASGKGKYVLINLRKIPGNPDTPAELAASIVEHPECVEFGSVGDLDEFFLIKLKDQFAMPALAAYANAALHHDREYAKDIWEMAMRSGPFHPACKIPD